jgi:phosphoglycolate phosphatase
METDLLVFDLDGTLIDSKLDLALAVNATRADAGLQPLVHETVYSYVGNGAPVLIRKALGPEASDEQVEKSLQFFLNHYRKHMLDNTRLYPGVGDALEEWAGTKKLAVLTNKPERFSRMILDGLGVGGRFARVYGGNSFDTKKPDPLGLNHLMDELQVSPSRALMVGDSAVDVQTARNAGVHSCGVTYGLQPETFQEWPPDFLVDRMEELVELLRNGKQG